MGNKNYGCGIFIDLRKAFDTAFDTANHDILIQKLEHYGLRDDISLNWFRSYLKRSISVCLLTIYPQKLRLLVEYLKGLSWVHDCFTIYQ